MTTLVRDASATSWQEANHRYLLMELERLRLLIKWRILWLRTQWKLDPLQGYAGLVLSDERADRLLAATDRGAEIRFHAEDAEAADVGRRLRVVEQEVRLQLAQLEAAGRAPALHALADLLALSPFERDLVLLCVAPELDDGFERLYGYVQDDLTRKHPTLHLALILVGPDKTGAGAARECLMPHMPLRRLRLISLEAGPGSTWSSGLRLSERARDYLLGVNRIDDAVAPYLRQIPSTCLSAPQREKVDRLAGRLRLQASRGWPIVEIVGPRGCGKRALAQAVAGRLGLELLELEKDRLPVTLPERQEVFRLLEREALLSQFAVYLDASAAGLTEAPRRAASVEVLDHLRSLVIVGAAGRIPNSARETLTVTLGPLTAHEQRQIWRQALRGAPDATLRRIDHMIEQFRFGPAGVGRVVAAAGRQAGTTDEDSTAGITAEALWEACRTEASGALDELAQRLVPCHGWDDIVLPEDVRRQLHDVAAQVARRPLVYDTWGFGAKLNRGRGISALFSGPSGTGKTLAAEILAADLRLDLYGIDLSGVISKYIGETEKNLRRVFDAAEDSGAVLFFDEADALFGKRSEVKDSHDRYANIEINYLLQRMEDYRGLAILATNMKSQLDQAFLRRLRFVLEFPFPGAAHRALIWRKALPAVAPVDGLDFTALSRMEIPGGNIKNIAINAAFLAAARGASIAMADVCVAARREYQKIQKLPLQAEFGSYYELVCS